MVELSEEDLHQIVGGYQQEKPTKDTTKIKKPKDIKWPPPPPKDTVYVPPLLSVPTFHP